MKHESGHTKININGNTYLIGSLTIEKKKSSPNYKVYTCLVFNEEELFVDNFKLIYCNGEFAAWTYDLLTQVEKKELRNNIAELFNNGELKISA